MRNLQSTGDWVGLVDSICRIAETFGDTSAAYSPNSNDSSSWLFCWAKDGDLFGDPYTFDAFIQVKPCGAYLVQLDPEISSMDGGDSLIGWFVASGITFTIGDRRVGYTWPSDPMESFDAELDEEREVILE